MKPEKILIATPTIESTMTDYTRSLVGLDRSGYKAVLGITEQTLVGAARTSLVKQALDAGCDHILWIDSDMIFEGDILHRLAKHAEDGLEYISALYFSRQFPMVPILAKSIEFKPGDKDNGAEIYFDYPKDQLFEIAASGFGCVLTKTSLFTEVIKEFKCSPFDFLQGFGEDYSFCWRLKQLGKKMYCDSSIKLGHIGYYVYTEEDYLAQVRKEET